MKTVAEGVETIEQVEYHTARNIHCLQGYYFAKPMPIKILSNYSTLVI